MSGIDYDCAALYEALLYCQAYCLVYEHIKQVQILQTYSSELAQRTWIYHIILRHHTKEVLIRQVITRMFDNINIRERVDGFQKKVLEHSDRIFCNASIVRTILGFQLFVNEIEVNKIVYFTKKMVLRDEHII